MNNISNNSIDTNSVLVKKIDIDTTENTNLDNTENNDLDNDFEITNLDDDLYDDLNGLEEIDIYS